MAVRLPATVDVEAAPGVCGAAGRRGGRDTSTAVAEADCCHCLVVTVDGSNESAALWINVDAATLRLPPRRRTAAIASYHRQREARELTDDDG